MSLHNSTFLYLKPTDKQMGTMDFVREAYDNFAKVLQQNLPDGADKTHVLRLIRTAAMWSHVAITRNQDGSPRDDMTPPKPFDPGADAGAFASMDGKR